MKEKKNIGLSIFLFLIILVLLGYILVDKQIIEIPGLTKNNTTEEKEDTPSITEIDVDDANVKALIRQVHNPAEQFDTFIYQNGGGMVEDMTEEYKFAIATNTKDVQLTPISPADSEGNVGYVDEEDIKEAYERLFGSGTYRNINSFTLGCASMSYDSVNSRYVTSVDGCGVAISPVNVYEEIINAQKENDMLTVVTAVAFYDSSTGKLYKDVDLTDEVSFTTSTSSTEEDIRGYVNSYQDSLTQYTYTFQMGNDGFYYYAGVERTKE